MSDGSRRPIFIVGCQRSGTTMLRLMLDSHSQISCGPETRFLEDLERIVGPDWKRLSQFGYSQEEWLRRIRVFFEGIQTDYAHSRGKTRWADKSPRYALHIPFLLQVFPDAQIVHVIRDGRDVAVSHRKRFGYWSSVKSSVKWPRYIRAARTAGLALPSTSYYELRYDQLVADSEHTLQSLLEWLGEDWEPEVLEFATKSTMSPSAITDSSRHATRRQGLTAACTRPGWGPIAPSLTPWSAACSGSPPEGRCASWGTERMRAQTQGEAVRAEPPLPVRCALQWPSGLRTDGDGGGAAHARPPGGVAEPR